MSERGARHRDTALVAGVALALALAFFDATPTPDGARFARQAAELRAGQGFLWEGAPSTRLPPGYPFFLALLPAMSPAARGGVNVALWTLACALLHVALRPAGAHAARLGALALAANPWAARLSSYPMSEPLALALLVSLLLCARPGHDRAGLATIPVAARAALVGLLASAVSLTAPGLSVLAAGVLAVALWRSRAQPAVVVTLLLGAALPMLPWQLHCLRATGHVEWLVVGRADNFDAGRGLWARTWLLRESELSHVWHAQRIADAPARAFRDAAEREWLTRAAQTGDVAALDQALAVAARARRAPLRSASLTAARALLLWTDMPALGHLQPAWVGRFSPATWRADVAQVGARRALLRLAKALTCTLAQAAYAAYALALAVLAWRGLRARDALSAAVLIGTLAYTLVSAHTALGEARRNLPFTAALLALPSLWRHAGSRGHHAQVVRPRVAATPSGSDQGRDAQGVTR